MEQHNCFEPALSLLWPCFDISTSIFICIWTCHKQIPEFNKISTQENETETSIQIWMSAKNK